VRFEVVQSKDSARALKWLAEISLKSKKLIRFMINEEKESKNELFQEIHNDNVIG
jgi:hypothetical protein